MSRPIYSEDPKAVEKLQVKLEKLKEMQARMKECNAYYRKHGTLVGCVALTEKGAREMDDEIRNRQYGEKVPYPSYYLSNNNAEIRRLSKRVEQLSHDYEVGFAGWKFAGGEAKINRDIYRLQLFFDEKPSAEQRTELKRNGFVWSPTQGAWQRLLNLGAISAASQMKFVWPENGVNPIFLQPKPPARNERER